MDEDWGAPWPEGPPRSISLPREVRERLRIVRIEDIDMFGWKASAASYKEQHDADMERCRRMNAEVDQARAARRHQPSPSLTPPPPSQSSPQSQPRDRSQTQPNIPNKRKRLAEDAEDDDHLTGALFASIPKRQRRGVEMMDEGTSVRKGDGQTQAGRRG